jgi:dTDP-4-amino-4,6-dideoxygalactose transaminase
VTLALDLERARKLVTTKTTAIVLVHYGGVPANPEGFARLAEEHNLIRIEDNAHGLGGTSNGKTLGTLGAMSTLSFHETKNITCGEGGALVINGPQYIERAEILREKGTDRSRFLHGQVDQYTGQDLGSSWILPDILAAVLYAQLCDFDAIQERRMNLWEQYWRELSDWARENNFELAERNHETAHLFYVLLSDPKLQTRFLKHLRQPGISAVFHYQPLHSSPFGRQFPAGQNMSVTEKVSGSLVQLPLYTAMNNLDSNQVLRAVKSYSHPATTTGRPEK